MKLPFLFSILLFLSYVSLTPVELKIDPDTSCKGSCLEKNKKNIGCCKLKYPSGGVDFIMTSEENCKNNRFYLQFTDENDSLCFEWKESEILETW